MGWFAYFGAANRGASKNRSVTLQVPWHSHIPDHGRWKQHRHLIADDHFSSSLTTFNSHARQRQPPQDNIEAQTKGKLLFFHSILAFHPQNWYSGSQKREKHTTKTSRLANKKLAANDSAAADAIRKSCSIFSSTAAVLVKMNLRRLRTAHKFLLRDNSGETEHIALISKFSVPFGVIHSVCGMKIILCILWWLGAFDSYCQVLTHSRRFLLRWRLESWDCKSRHRLWSPTHVDGRKKSLTELKVVP